MLRTVRASGATVQFEMTGRVFIYRGRNFLLPDFAPSIMRFDAKPGETPAATDAAQVTPSGDDKFVPPPADATESRDDAVVDEIEAFALLLLLDAQAEHRLDRELDALGRGVGHAGQRVHLDERIEPGTHRSARLDLGDLRHRVREQLVGDPAHLLVGQVALEQIHARVLSGRRSRQAERGGLAKDPVGARVAVTGLGTDFDAVDHDHGP